MSESKRQTRREKRAQRKRSKHQRTGDSPEKVNERGLRGDPDALQEYAQRQGMFGAPLAGG